MMYVHTSRIQVKRKGEKRSNTPLAQGCILETYEAREKVPNVVLFFVSKY